MAPRPYNTTAKTKRILALYLKIGISAVIPLVMFSYEYINVPPSHGAIDFFGRRTEVLLMGVGLVTETLVSEVSPKQKPRRNILMRIGLVYVTASTLLFAKVVSSPTPDSFDALARLAAYVLLVYIVGMLFSMLSILDGKS